MARNPFQMVNGLEGDVEYFNGNQWRKIRCYHEGDPVLQYHHDGTATLCYDPEYIVKDKTTTYRLDTGKGWIISSDCRGSMIFLTRRGVLKMLPFSQLLNQYCYTKTTNKLITAFKYSGPGIEMSDNEIKLCLVLQDIDYRQKNGNIYIETNDARKAFMLTGLLGELQIYFKQVVPNARKVTFEIDCLELTEKWYQQRYNFTKEQAEMIVQYVTDNAGYEHYNTRFYDAATYFQFVNTSLGYRSMIRTSRDKHRPTIYSVRTGIVNYLPLSQSDKMSVEDKIKQIRRVHITHPYIYYFNVHTGMFPVRYRNNIYVIGRCDKRGKL